MKYRSNFDISRKRKWILKYYDTINIQTITKRIKEGNKKMVKRGTLVCIFGTLSFLASIHVFEAFVALFFDKEIVLLNLYPIIGSLNIELLNYLIASIIVTSLLMAVTFRIAFSSPLENYLNMILSDANITNEAECELVKDNRSVLDMICESITNISQVLGQTKDITYNVRSELVNLRQMPERTEKLST